MYHRDVGAALYNLAESLDLDNDERAAHQHYLRARAVWERTLPAGHVNLGYASMELVGTANELHRFEEAVGHGKRALAVLEPAVRGKRLTSQILREVAKSLQKLGRPREADRHFARAAIVDERASTRAER